MLCVLATRRQIAETHFAAQASVGNVFGVSWLSNLSVLATRQHRAEAHFAAQASVESVSGVSWFSMLSVLATRSLLWSVRKPLKNLKFYKQI